jgi:uncharacterized protein (TIGR02246 family)
VLLGAALCLSAPELGAQRCGHEAGDSLAAAEVAEGIIAADNNRDIDLVLGYYRTDAVLMPPGESTVRGRPSIRPRYEALFEQYDPAIVGRIDRVEICGDMAIISGRNGGWLRGRDDRPDRRLSDVYLMMLRFAEGRWRIARLIWHSDGEGRGRS